MSTYQFYIIIWNKEPQAMQQLHYDAILCWILCQSLNNTLVVTLKSTRFLAILVAQTATLNKIGANSFAMMPTGAQER